MKNSSVFYLVHFRRLLSRKSKIFYVSLGIATLFLVYYFGLIVHLMEVDYNRFSYPLDVPMEEILVAFKKGVRLPYQPINEYNYRFRIENGKKCQQGNNDDYEKVVLLYMIKSALGHGKRRDGIRKTWGWENRFSDVIIRRMFVLGVSEDTQLQDDIDEEYARNKDIVQAEFLDSYYNNTIKTMVAFKWVMKNCPNAQFVLFSDDDMYISTKNLLKFIRNPFNMRVGFKRRKRGVSERQTAVTSYAHSMMDFESNLSAFDGRLLAGFVFFSSPMRHMSSKWYVSMTEYPYSKYPPYVTAGAYVLSFPALQDLYYTSMFTQHFKFDDVYLGIVAKKCGIEPLHNEHFFFWRKPYTKEGYAHVVASHGFHDPTELKKVWEEQRSRGHA